MTAEMVGTRAAVYVRISSPKDPLQRGVKDQERQCRELCSERGWTVAQGALYSDHGKTAADPDKERPRYSDLLRDIQAGKVDHVVVAWPDRLHRRVGELEEFIAIAKAAGVGLTSVKGGDVDLTDPNAVMTMLILASVANGEVEKNRLKVMDRKAQHAREGRPSGGWRLFGYEGDGKNRTICESEEALIHEAADRVLAGETTYTIAKDWSTRGLRTPRGAEWFPKNLKSVLSNPSIAGLRVHRGEIVGDATWEPILEREMWESVQSALAASKGTVYTKRSYLLRGILVCGECGRPMAGNAGRGGKAAYVCKPQKMVRTEEHHSLTITGGFVDDYISGLVREVLDVPGLTDVLHAESEVQRAELLALAAADIEDQADLDMWADMLGRKETDRATYVRKTAEIRDRLAERKVRRAGIRGTSVLDRYAGRSSEWETWDQDTQRAVILALIESVAAARAPHQGRVKPTPDRLSVHWRFSAIESLVEQIGTGQALPLSVYQAARSHPGLAAWDDAWAEAARNLKVPAKVKAAIAES